MSALSRTGLGCTLAAAALLIPPCAVSAQEVGVKAGLNAASLTPEEDEDPDTSRRLGVAAGVWVRLLRASRVSFQIEALFSEKGVVYEALPGTVDSYNVRLRYFEVPLLARADFGRSGSTVHPFVVAGIAPAVKLSARVTFQLEGADQRRDVDDAIYAGDVGLAAGFGVALRRALIEARYTHGLRHINTDDNGDEDRIKNRVFTLAIGFRVR
ncbi:MAG TPA: porin family protein [Vicinamibacterales bacterium]|nr:porin family protein [Vicinamibacterales bacterium]